jgi:hypothetical protein
LESFKINVDMACPQHKQMQGESVATSRYVNAAVAQSTDDYLAEAAIDDFANLTTATAVDRDSVATLTNANSRPTKQFEEHAQELK